MAKSAVGLADPGEDPMMKLKYDVVWSILAEDTITKKLYLKVGSIRIDSNYQLPYCLSIKNCSILLQFLFNFIFLYVGGRDLQEVIGVPLSFPLSLTYIYILLIIIFSPFCCF